MNQIINALFTIAMQLLTLQLRFIVMVIEALAGLIAKAWNAWRSRKPAHRHRPHAYRQPRRHYARHGQRRRR
jgi:hypothetical protein